MVRQSSAGRRPEREREDIHFKNVHRVKQSRRSASGIMYRAAHESRAIKSSASCKSYSRNPTVHCTSAATGFREEETHCLVSVALDTKQGIRGLPVRRVRVHPLPLRKA